jgi:hypothetical protein
VARSRQQWLLDGLLLALLCVVISYFLVNAQLTVRWITFGDTPWYLNRSRLLWKGIFEDLFIYNVGFPVLVGLVDMFTRDVVAAGIVVNRLALAGSILGVYGIGRLFYNRPVAWIAVLVFVTNRLLFRYTLALQSYVLFYFFIIWAVVAFGLVLRYRSNLAAVLLGFFIGCSTYVRMEGALYGILIPIAAWIIYRGEGNWRLVLRLMIVSGVVYILVVIPYGLSYLSQYSSSVYGSTSVLGYNPIPWYELSRRLADTITLMIQVWPMWSWLVVFAAIIWGDRLQLQPYNWVIAVLMVLNFLYVLILPIWPRPQYANHFTPFFAVLFAALLWQFTARWPRLRWAIPISVLLVSFAGLDAFYALATRPAPPYIETPAAQTGRSVDAWLADNGFEDTEIFTWCTEVLPFSRGNFRLLYRLGNLAPMDPSWWNTTDRLLPQIREQNKLFMDCPDRPNMALFLDWVDYLEHPSDFTEQLQAIGSVDEYTFYRVVQRP